MLMLYILWMTNFYDFRFKSTATAAIGIHPTKAWLSKLVNFKKRRTICNRIHREQGLDYREAEELSWCSSWSNSMWQGWICGLVHCSCGNVTDPIWRVLASSDGISSWTPLKPGHSNTNPNPLANQLWCINSHTSHHSSENPCLPCLSKTDARFMQDGQKAVWSIPYVSVASFSPSLKQNFIAYRSSKVSSRADCNFETHPLWQSGFSRVYSNCCCSYWFEAEIIKIGQSSHKM